MDSHVGLDYIVDNPEYCVKLASALETACSSVKKQVVELLSALCVYSQDGRQRAIDTLHTYQERKGERYRLRIVVDELQKATSEDYQTALLAFINCLVISTPVLKDRIRIRNEFIGLKLLPILNELRKSHVSDVRVQLNAFDYQQEADEELTNHGPPGIDLSSHVDVFYAILGQVADTPQEIPFLSVLQHLLRLDPKDAASDLAWDIAETLVHRATLLESREDATKLLRSPSLQMNLCCHCRGPDQMCGTSRKTSLSTSNNSTAPLPPPPPPPIPMMPSPSTLPSGSNFVLPPPPPPLLFVNVATSDASMETMMPPPLHVSPVTRAPTPELPSNHARLLPQQEIPTPKTKMKTINWNKIPNHKVIGKRNIWSLVANDYQNSTMSDLDWAEMEGLFCQQVPPMVLPASYSTSYGTGVDIERRRREPTEIALLDGKRSLNVSIFLKQFRSSNENIIQLIKEGGHDDIGAEKLRGLLKILPEVDELEMLKSFDGDKSKLGNAEKFFLQLIQVPNYKLRIECMLLKEEFAANMSYLELSINSMILAGEDLMTNKLLQEVLYMVLVAGNFLNSGGYAGNAAGVKLSSLQKLTEIRANKPGMNLIHYVALQAERKRKNLLSFAKNITALEAATKTTIEQLTNEFNSLDTKIIKIKSQIQFSSTENDIQEQMAQFLQMAEREMAQLKRDMEELEGVRRSLAEFFCEDTNTFKIEECFRIFHQFYQKFNQAITENERRRIQEEQVLARRKQREEQLLARKRLRKLNNQAEMPVSESESNLMDHGLFDLHTGLPQRNYSRSEAKMRRNCGIMAVDVSDEDVSVIGSPNIRRRLGSCPGGSDHQSIKEDTYSPDITPNGTLRRRRSRIPCEDDDGNLMDFLRTSGQDNTRERKSWGSLDRSWARRARGQSRRGDLLNADFSGDRERPSSPAPLAESKPFLQEEEAKSTGKAWRQKIEEWLSENEKEDRADEQLQRKTKQLHQANRRSFEDSESEGKNFPMSTSGEDQIMLEERSSSKVYDWRPSVEKTDVMRTMEAIEEVQISSQDKSPWRKSSLNLSSSTEEIDPRKNRSRLSTENALVPSTLQAITEEDRKKNKISDVINLDIQDELTIYLRQPYTGTQAPATRRFFRLGRKSADKERINDKIEIDSDNIETPPAIRRLFSPSKDVKPVEKEPCKRERCNSSIQGRETKTAISKWIGTDLGTGNFDRYSATRRTRRYRKTLDLTGNKDKSNASSLEMVHDEKSTVQQPNTLTQADEEILHEDADAMLRIWQDKLKRRDTALMEIARSNEDLQCLSHSVPTTATSTMGHRNSRLPVSQPLPVLAVTNTVLSPVMQESRSREPVTVITERAVTSRERHRSMIDPSQVKEAVRLSSNPPSQVNQNQEVINGFSRNGNPSLRDRKDDMLEIVEEEKCADLKSTGGTREFENVRTMDDPCDQTAVRQNSVFRNRFVPDVSVTTSPLSGKSRDQELNDEGFEETQSLVSETLSQETSSGNYETDTHDLMRSSPAELGGYGSENRRRSIITVVNDDNLDGRESSDKLPASGKTFNEKTIARNASNKSNFLPKRTASAKHESSALRKIESLKRTSNVVPLNDTGVSKSEVQRSSSRSSLRSSRSSLNSATSVNTVKNLAANRVHLQNYTSAIRALTNDLRKNSSLSRPLPSKDAVDKRRSSLRQMSTSKIPASRSSNSSRNIGPATKSVQKESQVVPGMPKVTRGRPIASRSSSSGSSIGQQSILGNRLSSGDKTYATKSRLMQPRIGLKGHSFMRPTAASVNKGSTTNLPKNVKVVVKG
ncbi:PREDICTED: uncharacterized protein LOC108753036 isoform X3 [Trachymyrmex septentrionalis]|uniref:uncharacterized protein LOC108753036 isoform X3 n=1 Tax=Trachymyrmex septentrionalis TaxID=34720 RepID=UPI00084ED97F|nr:PREDICTED: uncharacterized protein LOC108753036 isoform X3 [Trachymyrmex septentrionalis]